MGIAVDGGPVEIEGPSDMSDGGIEDHLYVNERIEGKYP